MKIEIFSSHILKCPNIRKQKNVIHSSAHCPFQMEVVINIFWISTLPKILLKFGHKGQYNGPFIYHVIQVWGMGGVGGGGVSQSMAHYARKGVGRAAKSLDP